MAYEKGSTVGDTPSDVCACRLGNLCACLDKIPNGADDKPLPLKCRGDVPVVGLPVCQSTSSLKWGATNATSIAVGTPPNLSAAFRVGPRVCNTGTLVGAPEMQCFPATTQCDISIQHGPIKVVGKTGDERLTAGYEVQTYKGPVAGPLTLVSTTYDVAVDSTLATGPIHTYTTSTTTASIVCAPGESVAICVTPVAMVSGQFTGALIQFVGGDYQIRCLTAPSC